MRVVARTDPQGSIRVRPSGGQGSHMLHAMAEANALAILTDGDGIRRGERVELLVLKPDTVSCLREDVW